MGIHCTILCENQKNWPKQLFSSCRLITKIFLQQEIIFLLTSPNLTPASIPASTFFYRKVKRMTQESIPLAQFAQSLTSFAENHHTAYQKTCFVICTDYYWMPFVVLQEEQTLPPYILWVRNDIGKMSDILGKGKSKATEPGGEFHSKHWAPNFAFSLIRIPFFWYMTLKKR